MSCTFRIKEISTIGSAILLLVKFVVSGDDSSLYKVRHHSVDNKSSSLLRTLVVIPPLVTMMSSCTECNAAGTALSPRRGSHCKSIPLSRDSVRLFLTPSVYQRLHFDCIHQPQDLHQAHAISSNCEWLLSVALDSTILG